MSGAAITETPDTAQNDAQATGEERQRLNVKHAKLIRAYENYRAAGEIHDPAIEALMEKIGELEAQVEAGSTAPEQAAFPRLAGILWRDIMSDAIVRLAASCAHDGAIREIDAPFACDILGEEIRKCGVTISRGNGYARQFGRLTSMMTAVLRRVEESIRGGERSVEILQSMIEI